MSMKTQEKTTIDSPVSHLPYVNQKIEKLLQKLGIKIIRDLLMHLPAKYVDFSSIKKMRDIAIGETCTVQGEIISIKNRRLRNGPNITEAVVADQTGSVKAVWFNQPFLIRNLREGQTINLSGKTSLFKKDISFTHPAYETLGKRELAHTGRIIPIYPETKGMTSRRIRFLMAHALKYAPQATDVLPKEIKLQEKFLPLPIAIKNIHFPSNIAQARQAKNQLAFENLLIIQLIMLGLKKEIKSQKAPQIKIDVNLVKNFVANLPFLLTNAQKKSAWQILKDMEKQNPMNRLLNGDVGSGKTMVAAIAALNTAKQNHQVGYLAPTEILARQHFQTFFKFLNPFGITIALATGSENKIFDPDLGQAYDVKKNELLQKINEGKIDIAIGTHALIQDKIKFANLGLVIIDEQHRFGVNQRAALLKNSEKIPHLLSMTATPIPRTLMLTVYGDLDISIINEMPKNRQKIITKIIPPAEKAEFYTFIKNEVKNGRQVFVVCPRIELTTDDSQQTTNNKEIKAVKEEYKKLSEHIFPDLKIAMLHGKLKPREKDTIMTAFKNNEINMLVSTSVIEVGIDVPNATIMLIEEADRFGLAQLHQFRGRIGRGEHQSYCLLSANSDDKTNCQRLKALVNSDNGFKIAEYDLEFRGPGEFLGHRQWGVPDTAFASLTDIFLLQKIRSYALDLIKKDPKLEKYSPLKDKLLIAKSKIHLE